MTQAYPMQHKIKRPKPYIPACATDIRVTLDAHRILHQTKMPTVVLKYPIKVK